MRKVVIVAATLAAFVPSVVMTTQAEARGRRAGAAIAGGIFGAVIGAMVISAAQQQAQAQAAQAQAAQAQAQARARARAQAQAKARAQAQVQIDTKRRALTPQDTYAHEINSVGNTAARAPGPAGEIDPVRYMEGKW